MITFWRGRAGRYCAIWLEKNEDRVDRMPREDIVDRGAQLELSNAVSEAGRCESSACTPAATLTLGIAR